MGYCFDENLKAIIYDYMKNGSLYDWIHNVFEVYIYAFNLSFFIQHLEVYGSTLSFKPF